MSPELSEVDDPEGPSVTYVLEGRIAVIELNRPRKRNALSAEVLVDLGVALDRFADDPGAQVAILRGRGPSFCSGFDLGSGSSSTASTKEDPWSDRRRLRKWIDLALRLWEAPRPIVAQVHGHCLAGGILLPLCSDIAVVSETCVLGWPRLPMGAGFMDGAMAQLIGQRRAKQISYEVGSRITGVQAAEWGFANFAVPADDLEAETLAFAERIAKTPRNVLEIRKAAITKASSGQGFREALLSGVEWDAIAHVDADVAAYRALVRRHGMKAVIDAFEGTDDPFAALDGTPATGAV
jgi:enoyl-CoA hydratase